MISQAKQTHYSQFSFLGQRQKWKRDKERKEELTEIKTKIKRKKRSKMKIRK